CQHSGIYLESCLWIIKTDMWKCLTINSDKLHLRLVAFELQLIIFLTYPYDCIIRLFDNIIKKPSINGAASCFVNGNLILNDLSHADCTIRYRYNDSILSDFQ